MLRIGSREPNSLKLAHTQYKTIYNLLQITGVKRFPYSYSFMNLIVQLIIPFILLFLSVPSVAADLATDSASASIPVRTITLNPEEQKWLEKHKKIRIAFDGDFPPFSFVNDKGIVEGVAVEIISLLSRRLGIDFEIYPHTEWSLIYEAAVARKTDVVATMVNRPERRTWFFFTQPYLNKSLVIITRKDNFAIKRRTDIAGKKIALVDNYQYVDRVREEFPSIKIHAVDSFLEGLKAVANRQADAAITFTGTGHFLIDKHQLNDLNIAAFYDHNSANESIAIRKDWPELASILQKGLDSLSSDEKQAIFEKWVPKVETVVTDYVLIGKIVAAFAFVLLIMLLWIVQVRRQNRRIEQSKDEVLLANQQLVNLQNELENLVEQRTAELKASEQQYRSLVENLRHEYFFYRQDRSGLLTYVSPSVCNILGYSAEEFIANHRDFLTDNAINLNIDKNTDLCLKGIPQPPYEVEVYDSNGYIHWLEVMDSPVLDQNGQCIGVDGIAHDVTERKETHELLTSLSYYDDLTGLANRRLFADRLQQAINLAHRNKASITLFYLDLDKFKSINDTLGHAAGDEVLKETAEKILSVIRDSDIAARMGGDEFVILLPDSDAQAALSVAEKLIKVLQQPYYIGEQMLTVGSSIGISVYPGNGTDGDSLINHADTAMYHAKKEKLGYAFYSEDMQPAFISPEQLTEDLVKTVKHCLRISRTTSASALENVQNPSMNGHFLIYYQSRHALINSDIIGFESLVRWYHPEQGILSPSEFLPIAEKSGLIDKITDWVVRQVCSQALAWEKMNIRPAKISINLSVNQVQQQNLVERILRDIDNLGATPSWLEIEIKESTIMQDIDHAINILHRLNAAGLSVAIDDINSDSPILERLDSLPAQTIKIDRALIRTLPVNNENADSVVSIINKAHAHGKAVTAEGVESESQLDFLKASRCDNVQGFYFSKPLAAAEAENFLKSLSWFLDKND